MAPTTVVKFSRSEGFDLSSRSHQNNLDSELLASRLSKRLDISVSQNLIELALTHRSFAYESGGIPTNERLEFLGDSVLGLIITEELYRRFPDLDESRLSPLRSSVVNTQALADLARSLQLGDYLRIGKGEEVTGGRDKNSILADSFEAVIGAIYLDNGLAATQQILLGWLTPVLDRVISEGGGVDSKSALQELSAALGYGVAEYEIQESGPDHDKSFTARAIVNGTQYAWGNGKSKRQAEQIAAKLALDTLKSK